MTFISKKVTSLPPYLFSVFEKKKQAVRARGVDVIDLGIGIPDTPTPSFVIERLTKEAADPKNHRYAGFHGDQEYRQAIVDFYQNRHGVALDPNEEVLPLIGSKEGIVNFIQTVLNPDEGVLVPSLSYPVYRSAVHLAGGEVIELPLDSSRNYAPDFQSISASESERAKLMLLNYPANPTAGTVDISVFEEAQKFAEKHDLVVMHDSAYDLITYGGYKAPSYLRVPGAKERAVELGSLSKSFNLTGWRIGYAVGNRELIRGLQVLKSNVDTGQSLAVQKAAATALQSDFSTVEEVNRIYEERVNIIVPALRKIGLSLNQPKGTFFLWAKLPQGETSMAFTEKLLETAGIVVTPGTAFGPSGEGYIRISLGLPTERLQEVVQRLKNSIEKGEKK